MKNKPQQRPSTLREQLIADEHQRHARRLAELKKADAKLRMLEPTAIALDARGIRLWPECVRLDAFGNLSVSTAGICTWDARLYDALLDLGYTQVSRSTTGPYSHCSLKKGRLTLALMIPSSHRPDLMPAEKVQTSAREMYSPQTELGRLLQEKIDRMADRPQQGGN